MSTSKTFECQSCETEGKIVIRTEDVGLEDVVYCPVCGGNIFEEEDE
jgi:hypothetical protein